MLVKRDHLDSNSYVKIASNSDKNVFSKLNCLIDKHVECLTKTEHDYLTRCQWKFSSL